LYIVFLLAGCRGQILPAARTISEYKLISVMGLDRDQNSRDNIALTLSAKEKSSSELGGGKSSGGEGGDRPLILTNEARSVALAYQEMQTYTTDFLFLGHVRYVLLGEEAAREGILRYLDYISRDPDGRFLARLYVVEDASARDLMSRASTNESYIADRLNAMEADVGVLSASHPRNLTQTLDALYGSDGNLLLPMIRLSDSKAHDATKESGEDKDAPPDGDDKNDNNKDSSSDDEKTLDVDIAGYAVFADGRMVGRIGTDRSPAVNFLHNTVRSQMAEVDTGDGQAAALRILNANCRLKPHWTGRALERLVIEVEAEAALNENQSGQSLNGRGQTKPLAEQFDRWLETQLMSVVEQTQALGADVLGLGARLDRMNPIRFSSVAGSWKEIFPSLPVSVTVKTAVVRNYEMS